MICYSPAQWAAMQQALAGLGSGVGVATDERCVNEDGQRADGSYCKAKAGPSGWCDACWRDIKP